MSARDTGSAAGSAAGATMRTIAQRAPARCVFSATLVFSSSALARLLRPRREPYHGEAEAEARERVGCGSECVARSSCITRLGVHTCVTARVSKRFGLSTRPLSLLRNSTPSIPAPYCGAMMSGGGAQLRPQGRRGCQAGDAARSSILAVERGRGASEPLGASGRGFNRITWGGKTGGASGRASAGAARRVA